MGSQPQTTTKDNSGMLRVGEIFVSKCGALKENISKRFIYFKVCFMVAGTVWEKLENIASLEDWVEFDK